MVLKLRPLELADSPAVHAAITGSVARYFYDFTTEEETCEWVTTAITEHQCGYKEEYAIYDDEQFIGLISPNYISATEAGVGMWISEAYQGKGYGRAALRKLMEHLANRGITRLHYETEKDNNASVGLARSLNFTLEETGEIVRFSKDLRERDWK